MIRPLLVVAISLVASIAAADEPAKPAKPAKPIGTWKRSFPDGSWSIAFEESRIVFTALGPAERVRTLSATKYEISDEDVLFGYLQEGYTMSGVDEQRRKGIWPFACRIKVNGDTLTVSQLTVTGLDARCHTAMTGNYKKEAVETASKPQSEVKK